MFQIAANSIKYFEKNKNGDHYCIKDITDEKILVAAVADGVSLQPCDWLASELICQKFIDFFIQEVNIELSIRIKSSLHSANEFLINTRDRCQYLNSTLSLVVWKYDTNTCLITNIGDSRIYKITDEQLRQLTTDDAIRSTKQVMTSIGKRTIEVSNLTNVVGVPSPKVRIQEIEFSKGSTLLLATDGYYEARRSSFQQDMIYIANHDNLEHSFSQCFSKYELSAKDDMTAIAIKRTL